MQAVRAGGNTGISRGMISGAAEGRICSHSELRYGKPDRPITRGLFSNGPQSAFTNPTGVTTMGTSRRSRPETDTQYPTW